MSLQVRARLGRILGRTKSIVKGAWQRFRVTKSISSATAHIGSLFYPEALVIPFDRAWANPGVEVVVTDEEHSPAEGRDQYFYARHFGPGCEIRCPKGEFDDPPVPIGWTGSNSFRYNTSSQIQIPIKKGILAALRAWLFYGKK